MRNLIKKIILLLFIFPFFSCAAALQPNSQESSPSAKTVVKSPNLQEESNTQNKPVVSVENKITIKGLIFEAGEVTNGKAAIIPVEGAKVEMGNKSTYNSTLTDKDGKYALSDLPFGLYTLKISKESFITIEDPTYQVHGNIGGLDARITRIKK